MKKDNKSLNTILESYQSLEMMIIENEGEIDKNIEEMLEINESELIKSFEFLSIAPFLFPIIFVKFHISFQNLSLLYYS